MKKEPCLFCEGTGQVVSSTTISGFKTCDCIIIPQEESKQETLKEAAINNYPEGDVWTIEQALIRRLAFMNGAKYQAERMYSEEEMKLSFEAGKKGYMRGSMLHQEYYFTWKNFKQWFEQFKKK
jgi:hypothetical protein